MNRPIPNRYRIVIGYGIILIFSWFIWWAFPRDSEPEPYITAHPELDFSFHEIEGPEGAPVFLLYPDSFDGPSLLIPLAERLSNHFRVIIPDYQVGERSDDEEYSPGIRALQGQKLTKILDAESIHVGGYGYGGAVAINHAAIDPERVSSLILMASPGIQQMHFLGNHRINRTLYSLLYPVHYAFRYAVPHGGFAAGHPFSVHYIRAMREMDLRDAEGKLRGLLIPVSLIYPEKDRYTPVTVAKEIHRIVPQSELILVDGSYRSVSSDADRWSDLINRQLSGAERGELPSRDTAERVRVEISEKPFDAESTDTIQGLTLLIVMGLLIMAILVNEDFGSITAGLLVATGIIDFQFALITCFIGILLSDVIVYSLGRSMGAGVLDIAPFKWVLKQRDLDRAEEMFEMRGAQIIFITRFLPGTRIPTYLTAGILKIRFLTLVGYFSMAIAIWAPLIVGLSSLIGQPMLSYLVIYQDYAIWIVMVFILFVYAVLKYVLPLSTIKGRRQFYVRIVRIKERLFGGSS